MHDFNYPLVERDSGGFIGRGWTLLCTPVGLGQQVNRGAKNKINLSSVWGIQILDQLKFWNPRQHHNTSSKYPILIINLVFDVMLTVEVSMI
jgi:inner membrane protein involved in colicin E2 resistance